MTRLMTAEEAEKLSAKNRAAFARPSKARFGDTTPSPKPVEVSQRTPVKPSKHRAVKVWVDGERFDSKLEARVWQDLKLIEKAGEIRNLRRQVRFSLFMPGGEHYGVYTADFVYDVFGVVPNYAMALWHRVCADAKSAHTRKLQAWQKVKKLMLACHGIAVKELP